MASVYTRTKFNGIKPIQPPDVLFWYPVQCSVSISISISISVLNGKVGPIGLPNYYYKVEYNIN